MTGGNVRPAAENPSRYAAAEAAGHGPCVWTGGDPHSAAATACTCAGSLITPPTGSASRIWVCGMPPRTMTRRSRCATFAHRGTVADAAPPPAAVAGWLPCPATTPPHAATPVSMPAVIAASNPRPIAPVSRFRSSICASHHHGGGSPEGRAARPRTYLVGLGRLGHGRPEPHPLDAARRR